ncbi:MAG: pyridoxal phosphate-dependent aminotransferase [Candidatus Eisenbacteria bacterium]|nr:pyridoxal phosphate-dependent aminotransferase [Candidatus Eisenbacteria bacterium]
MRKLADCMSRLGTETAFEVLAKAKALEAEGKDIIHLEIGEPDFTTPDNIKEAAIKALRDGKTGYCPAPGIPELRKAIAADAGKRRGVELDWKRVVVTPGAKPVMSHLIQAVAQPGDEVIYPNPGFPIYESMIKFVGAKPVPMMLREERDFRFDPAEFRSLVTDKTKLIIINSPQNPTGGVLSKKDLEAIAEVAVEHDVYVLTDEVYINIIYDGKHESILSFPGMAERAILLDGFSKSYSMTGWRLGYGHFPEELVEHITRLNINTISCTSHFSQWGALEAITGPQDAVATMRDEFARRREVIVKGLNDLPGVSCRMPGGAFYAFPNITGTGRTSKELEGDLLQKAGVATLSGTSFGSNGKGFLRLSYANSVENIRKALERIGNYLAG